MGGAERGHARGQHGHGQGGEPEEHGGPARAAAQRDAGLDERERRDDHRDEAERDQPDAEPERARAHEALPDGAAAEVVDLAAEHREAGVVAQTRPAEPGNGGARRGAGEDAPGDRERDQRREAREHEPDRGAHDGGAVAHRLAQHRDEQGTHAREQPDEHAEQRNRPRPSAGADIRRDRAVQRREEARDQRGDPVHALPPLPGAPPGAPHVTPLWHRAGHGWTTAMYGLGWRALIVVDEQRFERGQRRGEGAALGVVEAGQPARDQRGALAAHLVEAPRPLRREGDEHPAGVLGIRRARRRGPARRAR